MTKTVTAIFALVAGGCLLVSCLDNRANRDPRQVKAEEVKQAIKSAIAQLASRSGAVDDWEAKLSRGERFRSAPILTVELEKLWLQSRPILFIGSVRDIATLDDSHYAVSLERNLLSKTAYMFETDLQLFLSAGKERMNSFLQEHPELLNL